MKKISILLTVICILSVNLMNAQVAINTDGSQPDPSAMLDVKSTTGGLLIPRMTGPQRLAITNPSDGLLIYDISDEVVYYCSGGSWKILREISSFDNISDDDSDTKIQVEENFDEDKIRFDIAGTEYLIMDKGRLEVQNTGHSVFLGYEAGLNDDYTDNENVFVGDYTGKANTSGIHNTAVGVASLNANIDGHDNLAMGYQALFSNTSGNNNTGLGGLTLRMNTSGNNNLAVGGRALMGLKEGSGNVAVGYEAFQSGDYSNSVAIGRMSAITADDQVRLGNIWTTSIGGYAPWTNLSDERFKKDIQEDVPGLVFIQKLRPVSYHLNMNAITNYFHISLDKNDQNRALKREKELQTGFIAQEVEAAAQSLGYEFSGVDAPESENDYYGLRYAEFVVPLVKAVQEQQEMIEQQSKIIRLLQDRISKLENK